MAGDEFDSEEHGPPGPLDDGSREEFDGDSDDETDGEFESDSLGEWQDGESAPRTVHDWFFKKVFGQPENAASALRAITPEGIARHVDWSSLELDRGSLNREAFRQVHCDLLFKARWATGDELLLQILAEHQSTVDHWMALRGLAMVHALWERHRDQHPSSTHLPAVLMYVVYHGSTAWSAPTSLEEMIRVPDEVREALGPYVPSFRFALDDLHVASNDSLAERDVGPFARLSLVALKGVRREDVLEMLAGHPTSITSLRQRPDGDRLLEILMKYLWRANRAVDATKAVTTLKPIIGPEAEQLMMTFAQKLEKRGFDRGKKEGLDKGVEKGHRKLLLRLLEQRFGEVSDEAQARMTCAPEEVLERWVMRVHGAGSVDEVLADD